MDNLILKIVARNVLGMEMSLMKVRALKKIFYVKMSIFLIFQTDLPPPKLHPMQK
jgi:hypothetical protein